MSEGEYSVVPGADSVDITPFLSAAHELKAPLALIRQLSLGLQVGGKSEQEIARTVQHILLTSERALRLTTNLTKSARLDDSLFALEPVNPIKILEDALHELEPLYLAKGRSIQLAPRLRPLLAIANRDLLQRVLVSFGENALHYSDPGSSVTFGSHRQGEVVRIGVRDFGPAIPANLWQRLASAPQKIVSDRPESSGLGLLIARQFAHAMNGDIGIRHHQDGATFYIDIAASRQMSLL